MRCSSSSLNLHCLSFFLSRSCSNWLHLLPHLSVTFIHSSILPSVSFLFCVRKCNDFTSHLSSLTFVHNLAFNASYKRNPLFDKKFLSVFSIFPTLIKVRITFTLPTYIGNFPLSILFLIPLNTLMSANHHPIPFIYLFRLQKFKQSLDKPWGFQQFEAPRFQDNRHMKVVSLSALRTGRFTPPPPPRKYYWHSFLLEA